MTEATLSSRGRRDRVPGARAVGNQESRRGSHRRDRCRPARRERQILHEVSLSIEPGCGS